MRRYSTYVGATLAGLFTNSVFGIIMCSVYIAVWDANPGAGGYDVTDAVTFVWLGQAPLMTVAIWIGKRTGLDVLGGLGAGFHGVPGVVRDAGGQQFPDDRTGHRRT